MTGSTTCLVEGGAATAAAFLAADLVDRLLLYRAPILVGGGRTLPDIGLTGLDAAHGRWRLEDARRLGSDRLEVYERRRSKRPDRPGTKRTFRPIPSLGQGDNG